MRLVPLAACSLLLAACEHTPTSGASPDAQAMSGDAAAADASDGFEAALTDAMLEDAALPSDASARADARADGASDSGAHRLFNGVDLTGFQYDPAIWRVEDGAIVASAPAGSITTNTFLIHDSDFADFVLTGELWVGAGGNSGVQYRSRLLEPGTYRVVGYQMDGADGYWGALYEEGGRGLLQGSGCLDAAHSGTWVRFTISVRGNEAVHELAGKECARFVDEAPERAAHGLIALQYHVPGGFEVRLRELVVTLP